VPPDLDGSFVSNEFPLFEADDNRLVIEYLRLYFQQPSVWDRIGAASTGTTKSRNRWKETLFAAHVIGLPSVPEQRRIVDVMAAVDAQIAALVEEVDRAERALRATRGDLLQPKDHWESVTVGDVATPATGRAFPDRFQGVTSGLLPYFKVADMGAPGNERELVHSPNWLTDESRAAVRPRVCPPGTVVFPIIGAALLTEKRRVLVQDSAFDQNVMGLILGERVVSEYMFAVMSNLRLGDLTQQGAVPSVNQGLVAGIKMSLPPLSEQREIGGTLLTVHSVIEASTRELTHLRAFRSTLLTALLSQEIEIPAAYDDWLAVAVS
jgi:type I restriction enzyme S subunit